jgi:hypothetical protein
VVQRSRAERELLQIGAAFSDALQSYADATPAGMPPQPPSLKSLLRDPRFPGVRRHLRKLFVDPMTGKAEWGVVYLGDKVGILAVYSLSDAKPVKIGNFPVRYQGFQNRQHIFEWKFMATGKSDQKNVPVAVQQQPSPATTPLPPQPPVEPPQMPEPGPDSAVSPSEEAAPEPIPEEPIPSPLKDLKPIEN